ncbi:MAG: beta-N-acetylhexosaminidase [Lachnospiraceae bacterium]|jgi:hexosaminidase
MISFEWKNVSGQTADLLDKITAELNREIRKSESPDDAKIPGRIEVTVAKRDKGLSVRADAAAGKAEISYSTRAQFCRAYGILVEKLRYGDTDVTEEIPRFTSLTYMQDNSRNAVKKPETVKMFLRQIALMGYTGMMLYTEDTYEIPGEPYFGYMRGRFTVEELRDLDSYASLLGIELIPCIQTLAHLGSIFRWPDYGAVHDTADILLCEEEKTYELIEKMIRTCRGCFSSDKIHIGMDEAHMLGRGVYQDRHGMQDRFELMMRHLKRVLEICGRYGFRAMMWSDMFFRLLTGGNYYDSSVEVTEHFRSLIPENVTLVYWDYYTMDSGKYAAMFRKHREMTDHVAFAGGAWKWSGYVPLTHFSRYVSGKALPETVKTGITDILVTDWGDDGAECSSFVIGPILAHYAEYDYRGDYSEEAADERLWISTGEDYSDMMLLDCLNYLPDVPQPGEAALAPAKYLLYQDPLEGLFDCHINPDGLSKYLMDCVHKLQQAETRAGDLSGLFGEYEALAEFLAVRSTLGIQMKQAYDSGDREKLAGFADKCRTAEALARNFHEKVRDQWYSENKPFGFEVLDIRLAGVEQRCRTAEWTLRKYLSGELSSIPELEQERLPVDGQRTKTPHPVLNRTWEKTVSACGVCF